MRKQLFKTVLAAGVMLAMALTFSCSNDSGGGDNGEPSSSTSSSSSETVSSSSNGTVSSSSNGGDISSSGQSSSSEQQGQGSSSSSEQSSSSSSETGQGNSFSSSSSSSSVAALALPVITTTALPTTTEGETYAKQQLAATNNPTSWSIASGALPSGLILTEAGAIQGMPIQSGNFNVTIRATNGNGYGDKAFTLAVNALPAGSNLIYWGNNQDVNEYGWDDMDDTKEGAAGWSNYWGWYHTDLIARGDDPYFHSKTITSLENTEITFWGVGYRFVITPILIAKVLDGNGVEITDIFVRDAITIGGKSLYLYKGKLSGSDSNGTKVILVFE